MSAIFGIFNRNGRPVEPALLERMAATIAHRGPDGSGMWADGAVGLGHMMLQSTPESLQERLPLAHPRGDIVITADARIDNREELVATLNMRDRPAGLIPDSELILAAYERWGEDCPKQLLGDFAFVIWDGRQRKLFCARDYFGVKPFYYYISEYGFAFATEPNALLMLPEVPHELDEVWVAEYLTSTSDNTTNTHYRAIRRLPASHAMTVSRADLRTSRYWQLDPERELRLGSDAEYAEAFRHLFAAAVSARLRSAFPVGSTLSGGLDSSSVTCLARRLRQDVGAGPLPTFSLRFDEVTACSEAPYIDAAIAQGGLLPHLVHGDQLGPWCEFAPVNFDLGGPILGGNSFLIWSLYRAAQASNMRVVLDGFDGDSVVSHGTGYIIELAQAGRWLTFWRETKGYTQHFNHSTWRVMWPYIWRYGLDPLVPQAVRPLARAMLALQAKARRAQPVAPPPIRPLLNADLAGRIDFEQRRQGLRRSAPESEREHHHRVLSQSVTPVILEQQSHMAAALGVENRHPFWDRRLVEFCLALPAAQKLRYGLNRWVMRQALEGVLPRAIQQRGGKTDMMPNLHHGLRAFEHERLAWIFERLDLIADYVDATTLAAMYERMRQQQASEGDIAVLWRAGSFALWLHHNQQRGSAAMLNNVIA